MEPDATAQGPNGTRHAQSGAVLLLIAASLIALSPGGAAIAGAVSEAPTTGATFGAWSLLPPVVAIAAAVFLRRAVVALVLGVLSGALVLAGATPWRAFGGFAASGVSAAMDSGHATILLFSLALGAMMGVIQASGGGGGIAGRVTRFATNRRRGQLSAWFMGLIIFFDDYANSMLVGSAMRPITDRLRISREKLAFIIDATAAPVASLALVSSWIGVEVGYIGEQMRDLGIAGDPYGAFIASLPYRSYPWLMLFMVGFVGWSGRDFGPMLRAERRAQGLDGADEDPATTPGDPHERDAADPETGAASPVDAVDAVDAVGSFWLSLGPILVVVLTATLYMAVDGIVKVQAQGNELSLRAVFSAASSSRALLAASLLGAGTAGVLSLRLGALDARETLAGYAEGARAILPACLILLLAWMLGGYCKSLHTANYLVGALDNGLPGGWVPAAVFVLAAVVSFATGTSWGTMAILFPLALPLAHQLAPTAPHVFLGAISSILSGAVWGDHCSPISDTTVISSMAAGCDHMAHVETQLPYALLVGLIALIVCEIPVGLGWISVWVALPLGVVAVAASVHGLSALSAGRHAQSAPG